MFAIIALICFVLDPFIPHVGPWPMWILGLACLAVHMAWGIGWPWRRG